VTNGGAGCSKRRGPPSPFEMRAAGAPQGGLLGNFVRWAWSLFGASNLAWESAFFGKFYL